LKGLAFIGTGKIAGCQKLTFVPLLLLHPMLLETHKQKFEQSSKCLSVKEIMRLKNDWGYKMLGSNKCGFYKL
jgi:hypothetical protein